MGLTTLASTFRVAIYMAGDIATALRVIREHCYAEGACFTVTPVTFVYTGGEEAGFQIGLVNYPRFPSEPATLMALGETVARKLLPVCNQRSCLIVGDGETRWVSVDPPGRKP